MPLSGFSNVKKLDFGDSNNWSDHVDPVTNAIIYVCTEDDEVTITQNGPPVSSETVPCPAGTVVTDSGSGAVSVRTP